HYKIAQITVKNGSKQELYFTFDGHGSTRALTDYIGAVVELYSYDAFGNALGFDPSTALTEFLYSGEQFDSKINQQYLRQRYYDPTTGRFNRLDPFFGNLNDPLSLHKYAYANSDAINIFDPSGMFGVAGVSFAPMIASMLNGITADAGSLIMNSLYQKKFQWNQILLNAIILASIPTFGVLLPGVQTFLDDFVKVGLGSLTKKMYSAKGKAILPTRVIGKEGDVIGPGIANLADDVLRFAANNGTAFGATGRNLKIGSSTVLREELEKLNGLPVGTLVNRNIQAHHVIPKSLQGHDLLKKTDFNIDSAINGIPLKNDVHLGSHYNYNIAVRLVLDKIYSEVSDIAKRQEYILELITNASKKILDGTSLRGTTRDISVTEWYDAIVPIIK
ncbi:MAG: AHH domain-containing protein, partial [Planctomycetaceae bacterium]|nr:AHH domain-containing protein [Planctomycetaceae bacterium]